MVRALASHARGHRFKSCCLHQKKGTPMWCVFLLVKIGFAEAVYYHRFTRVSKNEKQGQCVLFVANAALPLGRYLLSPPKERHTYVVCFFVQKAPNCSKENLFILFVEKNYSKRLQCPSGCDKINIMKSIPRRNLYV